MTASTLRRDAAGYLLRQVIARYGPELLEDPSRTRAILADTMPEHAREVKVLIAALEEGVPDELRERSDLPRTVLSAQLRAKLERERGLSADASAWAVDAWAAALALPDDSRPTRAPVPMTEMPTVAWPSRLTPLYLIAGLVGSAALFSLGFVIGMILFP